MLGCSRLLCHGELRGCWCRGRSFTARAMLIDGRPAQQIQRTCFGPNCGASNVWDTKQELDDVSSCSMLANAVSQRAAWMLVPRSLNYRVSSAVSTHAAPRNGGASILGADGVHEAPETLSSSFTLRHHAWMLASAVSQSSGADAAIARDGRCEPQRTRRGVQKYWCTCFRGK